MKRLFITFMMAVVCMIGSYAQKTVVWETPSALSFQFGGGTAFTVNKMEFKKKETVMHLNVKFRPHNWIKFVKTSVLKAEDSKEYAIISGEPTAENESRIEPDSLFWMPESGEANLALHFKPLPQNTRRVDFIEGYEDGAFRIWNICEAKNAPSLPEEWRNIKYADNETLPETKLKKGVATLKVWMLDYKPGMDVTLFVYGLEPLIEKSAVDLEVKFDDNGCAVAEIPVYLTRCAIISIGGTPAATCLIAPGETTECIINPYKELEGRYTFRGYMARTNMDLFKALLDLVQSFDNGKLVFEALKKCTTPEERFDVLNDILLKKMTDKINRNTGLCDGAKALTRMEVEKLFLDWTFNFAYEYANMLVDAGEEKAPRSWEELEALTNKYKDMIPFDPFSKGKLMSVSFEAFTAPYATCSQTFWSNYPLLSFKNDTTDVKPTLFESIYGVKQIVKGNGNNKVYDYYTKHITDPGCLAALDDYYAKQERVKQELNAHNNIYYGTLDDVAPENILNTILDKYKGKVVLVDMWQTWCGPCRMGHKKMVPVKEELKDKNIAFVYLSSPSSPLDKWQQMVMEIPGNHYYLTNEQFSYIQKKLFESNGVPTYAIYDTAGNRTYKMIGFPGADAIKAELEKNLK